MVGGGGVVGVFTETQTPPPPRTHTHIDRDQLSYAGGIRNKLCKDDFAAVS